MKRFKEDSVVRINSSDIPYGTRGTVYSSNKFGCNILFGNVFGRLITKWYANEELALDCLEIGDRVNLMHPCIEKCEGVIIDIIDDNAFVVKKYTKELIETNINNLYLISV